MKIAKILLESKKTITTNQIALDLQVSNKTVRNDLKKLQDFIEREGLRLKKKTGVGTSIEGPKENKIQLLHAINKDLNYVQPYSRESRQNSILKRLFMHSGSLTTGELANELYVCTATIHRDLKLIDEWIQPFNLKLVKKRNHGMEIIGNEEDYRKAISYLISEVKDVEELQELLYPEYKGRIDYQSLAKLKALFNIDYKKLEDIVNQVENKLEFKFSQEAYISLIIHIAISMKRIKENKDIILSKEITMNIKYTEEFRCAKDMSIQMEKDFAIVIPESEIGYITLHILGSKVHQKDLGILNIAFEKVGELELAVEIAQRIIEIASNALNMELEKDHALLNGLVLHLRPTINRLKYGMTLRNPILDEIKANYPDIFGVAWMCSRVFEKYLDIKIPESEIGYIAVHLGAAVERNRKQIRTLVVCHSGIGTSQLLSVRLERSFKEIEIIGIVSSTSITKDLLDKAELIISTIPLQIDRPVLVICPLFRKKDIGKVDEYINQRNKGLVSKSSNDIYVKKEVFYRSKTFINYEQVINDMCRVLEKKQYIKKGFKQSVISREKMMATEVGNGIAIPHGEPHEVKKSCIALTVLKHPIKWEKEKVEFVFLICITKQDISKTKAIFRNLYRNMDKDEFLDGLRKNTNAVKEMLNKLEMGH